MQTYLFPYLGYFQLIAAVDHFVVHDDVQYIKGGWFKLNSVFSNGGPYAFTFSVQKASSYLDINLRHYSELEKQTEDFLARLRNFYTKAPHLSEVMELLTGVFCSPPSNVSTFNTKTIEAISRYLGISTTFSFASELNLKDYRSSEKVIKINQHFKANTYINPIGGETLYSKEEFSHSGLELFFIKSKETVYDQGKGAFVSNLSILDVMMFNSKERLSQLLTHYELI